MIFDELLDSPLSLSKLELLVLDVPQKEVFRSAIGLRHSRRALIVKWIDQDGMVGYGESSCRPDPYYSSEFVTASLSLIQDYLFPLLSTRPKISVGAVLSAMRKVRGWYFTKAAVEAAMLDLLNRKRQIHPFRIWNDKRLRVHQVPVGISIGLQPDYETLLNTAQASISSGYQRLKFKINPESNPANFARLTDEVDSKYISFDANGTFYPEHFEVLGQFVELGHMIEQATPPSRMDILQEAKKQFPSMFHCLDESIKTIGDLKITHQLGLIDELNLKPGRVGGIFNSIEMLDYCFEHQIPAWIGGMFETGIGRIANLQLASFLREAKAHDLSPSSRYFVKDIIKNPVVMTEPSSMPTGLIGHVLVDSLDSPEIDEETIEEFTIRTKELKNEGAKE